MAKHDVHELKTPSDDACASEQRAYLFRRGIGGDIKVFWLETDDQIAYGTANNIGLITLMLKNLADLDGMTRNVATVDAMLVTADAL